MTTPSRRATRRRIVVRPGDVFSIPLAAQQLAFGRLTPQKWYAHFLAIRSVEPIKADQWRTLPRLPFTESIVIRPIQEGRWTVLGNVPWQPLEFRWQPYLIGGRVACGRGPLDRFTDTSSESRPATPDELNELSPAFSPLTRVLRSIVGPDSCSECWRRCGLPAPSPWRGEACELLERRQ